MPDKRHARSRRSLRQVVLQLEMDRRVQMPVRLGTQGPQRGHALHSPVVFTLRVGPAAADCWHARLVPQVDLIDDTFIVADPAHVAAVVHDRALWSRLWPGLQLTVLQDRAGEGIRWSCTGELVGTCEVWLEPYGDGVIVHSYLRAELPQTAGPGRARREAEHRRARRRTRFRQVHIKQVMFDLKDRLEAGRSAGSGAGDSAT